MTQRSSRSPASAIALLQQEVNQLFQRLALVDRSDRLPGSEWCPAVDVFETRDRLVVVAEVPGLAPDQIHVAFRNHTLVITGARQARRPGAGVSFHCLERPHGHFERTLPLDLPVDVSHARATLAKGVLTVILPRLRERRGRETVIPIERDENE